MSSGGEKKSVVVALILTFFMGPFGMMYSTVRGGFTMLFVDVVVAFFTGGFGLFILWPVQLWWAYKAAKAHNEG